MHGIIYNIFYSAKCDLCILFRMNILKSTVLGRGRKGEEDGRPPLSSLLTIKLFIWLALIGLFTNSSSGWSSQSRLWPYRAVHFCPSCSLPRGSTRASAEWPPPLPFRGGMQPAPQCFRFRFSGLSSHPWWVTGKQRGGWKGPQAAPAPGGPWQGWGVGAAVRECGAGPWEAHSELWGWGWP